MTGQMGIEGVGETLAAFRGLPKAANKEIRQASREIVRALVGPVSASAVTEGSTAALMARTVRPASDRLPALQAGGAKRVGRHKTPAYKLVARTEQGADEARLPQFQSYRESGYWFKPAVDRADATILAEWQAAADRVLRAFGGR